ncbi:MAG: hypothetical protein ABJA66_12420 [Actinomycetota bacterium]
MRKNSIKILLLFAFSLLLASCPGKKTPSQPGGIFTMDETEEAGNQVREANDLLKLIKQRFKDNEDRIQELQAAMKGKNSDTVKKISDQLVTEINAGTEVGEAAINKLRIAQEKNINEDFKEYLRLKIEALEKYVQAFEERRQAAILLRDGYDPKNAAKRDQVIAAFKQREDKFKEIVEDARKISEEANRLARDSLNRKS